VLSLLPSLRAFARSLSGNTTDADDLVQYAIVKAWAHADQFQPGTNLRAWLFTILRNHAYSTFKRRGRELPDPDSFHAARIAIPATQEWSIERRELAAALVKLPEEQRTALVLVAGAGVSYEEAATICGCALGTIKSRVNRARTRLAELTSGLPDPNVPRVAHIPASPL
jgi:RNA polymerase sigma-70 factor (ECF subfamily)